jgi:hypothetical protein
VCPVTCWNVIASPAMSRPASGVPIMIERSAGVRTRSASRWMPAPTIAAARPIRMAQPNSAISGRLKCGRPGIASENVPRPVQSSRPVNTSAPTPEASRPGSITSSSVAPPMPLASMSRNAPISGLPRRVLIAAKLPAADTTAIAREVSPGCRFSAERTAQAARPPPSAMSGASGPSTAPNPSVASAASAMPGM